jgi:LysR family transcriptional regulator, glycine cleavage system transcriptional activator
MSVSIARLPSLDLVRGFVAVGRRMSITLAAQDLCLTQSAVSRQVHALEDVLGIKLFERGYRSIQFTGEGERLFRIADVSVQQLQDVVGLLDTRQQRRPVTITLSTGAAALWLLPRLSRLQDQHRSIDVRIAASNRVLDLKAEGIDLAIRYCSEAAAPPGAERLFGERLLAVCHPALVDPRADPAEVIRNSVLLEFDEPRRPWLHWSHMLQSAGMASVRPRSIMRFNQYEQVIQAAEARQGIALGRLALIEPLLADGRLVALRPFKSTHEADAGYWLIHAPTETHRDTETVALWIKREAAQLAAAMDSMSTGGEGLLSVPDAASPMPVQGQKREAPA